MRAESSDASSGHWQVDGRCDGDRSCAENERTSRWKEGRAKERQSSNTSQRPTAANPVRRAVPSTPPRRISACESLGFSAGEEVESSWVARGGVCARTEEPTMSGLRRVGSRLRRFREKQCTARSAPAVPGRVVSRKEAANTSWKLARSSCPRVTAGAREGHGIG